jgi:hypothetical protein
MKAALPLLALSLLPACRFEPLLPGPDPGPVCERSPEPAPTDYGYPLDDVLRLNQVQVKGTHNSYHIAPPGAPPPFDFTHVPLDEGLERLGLRQFELDIHFDAAEDAHTVFHVPGVDPLSTCRLLTDCLQVIKGWSDTHPGHLPIFVWIEPKDDFDAVLITDYDAIDREIRSVWPEERLFSPDDLQGDHPSIKAALAAEGWPTLGALRDHIIIAMLDAGKHQEAYTRDRTTLKCRAMFANVSSDDLDSPFASFVKIDDPASPRVAEAVSRGLIVGSNVDAAEDTDEANAAGNAAALENGVHMMSSDLPELVGARTYQLTLPGGAPARCNPATAPAGCTSAAVEELPRP